MCDTKNVKLFVSSKDFYEKQKKICVHIISCVELKDTVPQFYSITELLFHIAHNFSEVCKFTLFKKI